MWSRVGISSFFTSFATPSLSWSVKDSAHACATRESFWHQTEKVTLFYCKLTDGWDTSNDWTYLPYSTTTKKIRSAMMLSQSIPTALSKSLAAINSNKALHRHFPSKNSPPKHWRKRSGYQWLNYGIYLQLVFTIVVPIVSFRSLEMLGLQAFSETSMLISIKAARSHFYSSWLD